MTIIYNNNFDSDTAGGLPTGWANKAGTWAVRASGSVSGANSLYSSSNNDADTVLYTGSAAVADMSVSYTMKQSNGTQPAMMGILLRSDAAASSNYAVVFASMTSTGGIAYLFKKTGGGGYSLVSNQAFSFNQATNDTVYVKAQIVGSTVTVWVGNGAPGVSPVATFTDSTITAAGYAGFYNGKDGRTVSMSVDDFVLDNTNVVAATAVTLSGPTTGVTGVASTAFTAGANGTVSGTIVVTPNDSSAGGTFNPTSVSLTSATPTATFTYTAATAGAKTIGATNNAGLTPPGTITYTAASTGDTTSPTMNGTLTASGATPSGFTLSWAAGSDNVGVVGYEYTTNGSTWNDVGNVLTKVVSGLSPGTPYTPQVRDYDAAGNRSSALSTSISTTTATNALTSNTGNILFSPYNWDIQASSAKTINAGAYFRTIFGGTSCTLTFDMTGIASPVPQISYRVDRFGPWINTPISASVPISIPADTADYASKGGHLLEVVVKSMTETQARWSTQATAVKLSGVTLDSGKTLSPALALPLRAIFYGDSITEGVRTVNMTAPNDTDRNDSGQGWSLEVARILGAEIGNVGFGATGIGVSGSGGVPALPSSYNYLYAGVPRSFTPQPDFVVLMEGTNDGGDITAGMTTVLNGLIAATTTTKIIVLRPFNGAAHSTQLQAAIAACTAPSRCSYVDTAGFFTTSNSSDNLHPYGIENITHIAPSVANAIRSILTGSSTLTLTSRTVSLTLADTTGVLANLTGLKVAFYDEATPDLHSVPRYKSATGTTNASGALTFPVMSTLSVGGTGCVVVQMADGRHYNGSVVVS